ncbi:pimeloyl-ACP methyl ester esterase BioH [Hydrogenovibrio kuenenii]|uniref:pimeloyl-ACP methyl ester esterase BioH n=1 Tax=Hydrogenovibrio kuenenii TaxID=63658 RepID=UPI0004AF7985|nr:pimeloyl-ACP methyl ester esterase BioH [Hydrogenovibrio kuenenii]
MNITLNRTFIPHQPTKGQTETNVPNLTLIHGWAAENAVWEDWAKQYLSPYFNLYLIELPGFGKSPAFSDLKDDEINPAWLNALAKQLPEKTHLLGWSLGGLLAQQLALAHPNKIETLICLASTPRFTQNDHWKWAVSPPLLFDFMKALSIEAGRVLKQFWHLQLQGSEDSRNLMKRYTKQMTGRSQPKLQGLLQGLTLLKDIDNRDKLSELQQPTLWLLGEHDPLIPKDLIADLKRLHPAGQIEFIQGASHMPFFSHPEATAKSIVGFIQEHTL